MMPGRLGANSGRGAGDVEAGGWWRARMRFESRKMREPKLPRRGCDTLAWGCYFSVREGAIRLGSLGPTTRWRKAVVHCSGVVELNGRVGLVLTPQLTQGHGGVERDPHCSLTALHSQNSEFISGLEGELQDRPLTPHNHPIMDGCPSAQHHRPVTGKQPVQNATLEPRPGCAGEFCPAGQVTLQSHFLHPSILAMQPTTTQHAPGSS